MSGPGDETADGLYSYTWDGEGRMTSGAGVTYTYDGLGERVKKSSGTLYWRGATGSVLAETDTSGNTKNEYIFFGARIARRDLSGNVYYYFGNHLGSAAITNATGSLCYDAHFYPVGGELAFTNTCSQTYKFARMEQDSETGEYHTQFRQYASNLGRWHSPDPLAGDITNPQSLNRYAYVLDNPTTLTDPLGLDSMTSYGPYVQPACTPLPPGLPASAYQQATKCATWLQYMKYNVNASSCLLYEYACGTNSSMGEDIFDALGAGYIGEPTGAYITPDEMGNFSVGFDIAQWYFEAGLDATMFSKLFSAARTNPDIDLHQWDCADGGTCTAVFATWVGSIGSASTGVLTPSLTAEGVTFPPVPPPSAPFAASSGSWLASPWDTPLPPLPPWPLPPSPQPVPTLVALAWW